MNFDTCDPEKIGKLLQWCRRHPLSAIVSGLVIAVLFCAAYFFSSFFTKLGEKASTPKITEIPKQDINRTKTLPQSEPAKKDQQTEKPNQPATTQRINQHTEGNQSPIINSPGGDVTITYGEPKDKKPKEKDP